MTGKLIRGFLAVSILAGLTACGPTLAQKKDEAGIHYRLGVVHLNERNLADALKELTTAIEMYPEDPSYHNALGLAYFAKGMNKEALASMNKAISIDRDYSEAYVNKAAVYMVEKRWPEAIDSSQAAIKNIFYRTPEFAWYNMGWSYYNMGELGKAIESYEKAVGAKPSYVQAWYSMGLAYEKTGKTKEAIQSYEKAVATAPAYLDAWFSMAMALVKAKDRPAAVKAFEKVIEIAPSSDKAQSAKEYIGLIK